MGQLLIPRAASGPLRIGTRTRTPVGGTRTKAVQADGGAVVGAEVARGIITMTLVMMAELERVSGKLQIVHGGRKKVKKTQLVPQTSKVEKMRLVFERQQARDDHDRSQHPLTYD